MAVAAPPDLPKEVDDLRKRRAYHELLERCDEALASAPADLAARLHEAKAWAHGELGKFNKAADDLTQAADELEAAGGAADEVAWLRARALEARFRASEEAPAAGIGASD